MKRRAIINIVLLLGVVAIVALNWLGRSPNGARNFELFPDMAQTARSNAFEASKVFPDGVTLRAPVPGTVRIDTAEWEILGRESQLVPGPGRPVSNPFALTDADAVARGKVVFDTYCSPCHGAGGAGDGTITKYGYPFPPDLTTGGPVDMDDLGLFAIISQGGTDMPSYSAQISPSDRWRAVTYLRGLQQRAAPATSTP